MAKNDKALVEWRLKKLIQESERLARIYIMMVYSGCRVESIKSADEFCGRLGEARERLTLAEERMRSHYAAGRFGDYITEPLCEYISRVREQDAAV